MTRAKLEKIIAMDNYNNEGNVVVLDVVFQSELLTVLGKECSADETNLSDGVSWFRHFSNLGKETSMGLSLAVVERIKWGQERVGWVEGKERQARVERTEEFGGSDTALKTKERRAMKSITNEVL